MSGAAPQARTGAVSRRFLSTPNRIVAAAAAILLVAIIGRTAVEVLGISSIGYRGRANLMIGDITADFETFMADWEGSIARWLIRRETDANSVIRNIGGNAAIDALRAAPSGPPPDIAGKLRASLALDRAYRRVEVIDEATGAVVASSSDMARNGVGAESIVSGRRGLFFLPDGRALISYLVEYDRQVRYRVSFEIDPEVLLEEAIPLNARNEAGLIWSLIDNDGKFLVSIGKALSRDTLGAERRLPPHILEKLAEGRRAEIIDLDGKATLAMVSRELPLSSQQLRLLVTAERKILIRPLALASIVSISLNLAFTLLCLVFIWIMANRAFRPLRELSEAVRAFSEGREPRLPAPSNDEIGFLIGAFGDLMSRESTRRRNLESEIASRTADLLVRNEVVLALALAPDDEVAYSSMLEKLLKRYGFEKGLIVYFDGLNRPSASFSDGRASVSLTSAELTEVDAAVGVSGNSLTILGEDFGGCVGTRLAVRSDIVGYVYLGRSGRPYHAREVEALGFPLADLAPLVYERRELSRREKTRAEAERELRRSEQRLRAFLEESRDMIYSANAEDRIAAINAAGLSLLGHEDRFEVVGRLFSDLALSPEDRAQFNKLLGQHGFVDNYEIVLKRADGRPIFCLETARAVKDQQGSVIEVQGIVKDITERIEWEKEIWGMNLELAKTNEKLRDTQMLVVQREKLASIGQLAAGVAHEINNPLGFLRSNHEVLRGFIDDLRAAWEEALASDPPLHGEIARRHDLEYVFEQLSSLYSESDDGFRRIIEIVKNLRNFARADGGGSFGDYDLEEGIRNTLVVARNEIKYVAIVELALGGVPHLLASGGEINQVLLNLVMNAAQAIEAQRRSAPGRIAISTGLEGERVVVTVDDDGPGVPEAIRLQVFDPFFTTKEPGKGTGLGLSISYDLVVNKHGGALSVGESPLGGARFRIELPLRPQGDSPHEQGQSPRTGSPSGKHGDSPRS